MWRRDLMSGSEIVIVVAAVVLTSGLGWFFFGPKKTRVAQVDQGVQVVKIKVQGGYSPDVIQVVRGVPVRMEFDRQESGDCTSRVVMPDFRVNQLLPAYATTAVDLVPDRVGSFEFACGMNMVRGRLQVVDGIAPAEAHVVPAGSSETGLPTGGDVGSSVTVAVPRRLSSLAEPQDDEAAERNAEIADLRRRVLWGAVLTAPVLVAVMAVSLFGADW